MNRLGIGLAAIAVCCCAWGCSDSVEPTEPTAAAKEFIGTWLNEDAETPSITRVVISWHDDRLNVRMWGSCLPEDCYWGLVSTRAKDADDAQLSVVWERDFVVRTQEIRHLEDGRLEVFTHSHYIDDSGREDREITEFFAEE